jgi:hypothetical protein
MTMNQRTSFLLVLLLSAVLIPGSLFGAGAQPEPPQSPAQQEPVLVGRVFHIEGQLLRYDPEEQQWVAVQPDAPWGEDDTLYSVEKSRAELILPNNTWVRIGPNTEVKLVALTSQKTEVDLVSGTARFLNNSSAVELKVTTPYGHVLAGAGSVLDIYAGATSVEVIALHGNVEFVHGPTGSHLEVVAGSTSLLADEKQVGVGTGRMETAWRQWNEIRDNFWAKRLEIKGESVKYVHRSIQEESSVLERYGRWSRIYYDGAHRYFWRPAHVAVGWAPFTVGSWMYWHGDWCWVPSEPFGYVTHHYGNWVLVGASWYWAPPVAVTVTIGGPFLGIGFGWYPGRVAWVHSHAHIGWLPLAPGEIYYSHRYWGPGSVVFGAGVTGFATLHNYRYARNAVIVERADFARVTNYRNVMVRKPGHAAFLNTYKAARVANDNTVPGFSQIKRRQGFSATSPKEKPSMGQLEKARQGCLAVEPAGRGQGGGTRKQVTARGKGKQAGSSALKSSPGKQRSPGHVSKGSSKSSLKSSGDSKRYGKAHDKGKGGKSSHDGGFTGGGGGKHSGQGKSVEGHGPKSGHGKWK